MRKLSSFRLVPLAIGAAVFALPSFVAAHDHHAMDQRTHAEHMGNAEQNFSGEQIFTQAERDLVERVRADISANRMLASDAARLSIDANQGNVTLTGTVSTEREKEEIERRARQALGVRSVENRITVTETRADARPNGSSARESTDRLAQSSSTVRSMEARPRATTPVTPRPLTDAERASVANPAPPPPTDRELLAKERMGGFPATEDRGRNAVGERSTIGSGAMHDVDRTSSTGPSGSRTFSTDTGGVDEQARVAKPAGDYAVTTVDRSIAASVRTALSGDPALGVTPENVHIKVDNGQVILHGWVNSQHEKDLIDSRVRELSGVQGVDNYLVVANAARPSR